jgi:MFS family permease
MKRLRWFDFISINLFWLGLNIRNNAVGNIFMPYLVAAFAPEDIRNSALGGMRTAGLIIAMLVQPAAGLLSDRNTSRFGRRRPYIFFGVILDLVFLVFIALSQNYWALLVAILLIQFSSNLSHGALQGIIPDQVPEDQRGLASGIKAIMELLPLILLGFTIAKLVGIGQFTWAVVATGVSLLVTMLLTMVLVKEEPLVVLPTTRIGPAMARVILILVGIIIGAVAGVIGGGIIGGVVGLVFWPFAGQSTALAVMVGLGGVIAMIVAVVAGVWSGAYATLGNDAIKQSSYTWWVVNRLLFFAAITSIQGFTPFFLMYSFSISREEGAALTGNLLVAVGLFSLVSALLGGWLSNRFGYKKSVGLSGWLATAGTLVLLSTIWVPNLSLIYVAGAILGLSAGLFTTTSWALGTSLVPPAEAGRYLGISNLAGAGAGMVGAGIGGLVADFLNGYNPGLGYFTIFAGYAVLFVLSVFSLRWVKKANR